MDAKKVAAIALAIAALAVRHARHHPGPHQPRNQMEARYLMQVQMGQRTISPFMAEMLRRGPSNLVELALYQCELQGPSIWTSDPFEFGLGPEASAIRQRRAAANLHSAQGELAQLSETDQAEVRRQIHAHASSQWVVGRGS
jgi:hypothetical protein